MCSLRGTNCISKYNSSHFSIVKELSTLLVSETTAFIYTLTDWFSNGEGLCLLRGANCISKYNSSHFSTVKDLSTLLVSETTASNDWVLVNSGL
jgi:hypothetical protein